MSTPAGQPEWLTVRQVAERWNCSAQTVLNLIHHDDRAKRLPAMELRGGYRVHLSAVEARENKGVVAERQATPKPARHRPYRPAVNHGF